MPSEVTKSFSDRRSCVVSSAVALGRRVACSASTAAVAWGMCLKVHIYAPDADSPAFDVAHAHTLAPYDDAAALAAFADACDVVTYEMWTLRP
jgi:phosphoribosylaminoimidazole carboxylase (NCAIR synthetase)